MKPTTKLSLVVLGTLLVLAAAVPVIPTTVFTRLMLRMENAAAIQAHLGVQPGNTNLTNFVTTSTVDGSGNIVTPGSVTTGSGNVDTRIASVVSSLDTFTQEDFVFGGQTNSNPVSLGQLRLEGPPSTRLAPYSGGSVLLDLAQPGFYLTITNETLSIAFANVPDSMGDQMSWPATITNAWTNLAGIEYGDAVPDSQVPFEALGTNEVVKLRFYSENNVLTYQYVGPQAEVLPPELGGTGETTGEAQAPKSIVGYPTYSSVTNAEINLGAGRIIRLDNTKDVLINTTASRLTSGETNGLGQVRMIEMLSPAANRIVWVNTNNFGLRGIAQSNYVPAGTVWRADLVNWGAAVNHNYLAGGGEAVAGGSGSTPVDLNDYNAAAWLGTNASGNLTDASGNGIIGYVRDAFGFTYSRAGKVEANSLTNNASGTSGFTNSTLNAWLRGTNSWTIMGWHWPNSIAANRYVAANWNNGSGDSWRFFINNTTGEYKLGCFTNGVSATLDSGLNATTTGWEHYALVYDKDALEVRFVRNGVQSVVPLLAALDSPATSGFSYGGYYTGGALSTAFRGGIEQFLVYTNKAMALDDIQRVYNAGAGKAFSTF